MGSAGDTSASWLTLATAKREAILGSIPEKWRLTKIPSVEEQRNVTGAYVQQFLSPREVEITGADAVGIVEKTTTGAWSAVEVIKAFCHRASLSHQLVNCLHETFFDAALADAEKLDAHFAEHGKPKGPLHGLPVSLKDQFHVKGVDTTMGYVGWIGTFQGQKEDPRSMKFESEMVRELRQLGAVLYCKTAVPHTLMCGETVNNIIEYTWNPTNRNLSCGGSSGGEGALIALGGSPGGFGTDIGGSIRIPSAFNGLFGLRPTSGGLPYEGMANSMDGQNSVLSVVGPLASSAGGVKLLTKSILSAEPWLHDPLVAEIPWRGDLEAQTKELIASSQLSVGFLDHDGIVAPHPPLKRALALLRGVVARSGNQAFEWQPPDYLHPRVAELTFKTWLYDGGADVRKDFALSGEPWAPQILDVWQERPEADASSIAETNRALRQCRKEYLDYWNSTKGALLSSSSGAEEHHRPADVFVAPCAPFAAVRPGRYDYIGYSSFVNGLDLPSVVVPITTVDKSVDVIDASFQPASELDKKIQSDYDPELYDGAPVSLQIIGRRYQEEKLMAIAEWLEGELKKASPAT
ncbi:amidase [Apiospora arundinis]